MKIRSCPSSSSMSPATTASPSWPRAQECVVRPLHHCLAVLEEPKMTSVFSSRRRHTRLQGDWEFRRVLFRSPFGFFGGDFRSRELHALAADANKWNV